MDQNGSLQALVMRIVAQLAPPVALAERSAENAATFDDRAPWYEDGSAPDSYLSPEALEALVARHLPPGTGPVLDLACGTGLMGERLTRLGHRDLVGCDVSPAMLDLARGKGIYRDLQLADLHRPLPFPPESFAAALCAGAFFADIVAPEALAHILPVLRPGGWLFCDIEDTAWGAGGFGAVLAGLDGAGAITLVEAEPGRIFAPGVLDGIEDPGCSDRARFVALRRR